MNYAPAPLKAPALELRKVPTLDLIFCSALGHIDRPQWVAVTEIQSLYVAHAPDLLRVPVRRTHTFRFEGALS